MAERGKTVRIVFPDGQERTFPQVLVDQDTAGWLFLTRVQQSPIISGVPAPIAAYRLVTLKGWEYVDTDMPRAWPQSDGCGIKGTHAHWRAV